MNTILERTYGAGLALPSSAWRINDRLITGIKDRLGAAGEPVREHRIDADRKVCTFNLQVGPKVIITVDREIRPGKLEIIIEGDGAQEVRQILKVYYRMMVYKISMWRDCDFLLQVLFRAHRPVPGQFEDQMKCAVRWLITKAGHRIRFEEDVDDGTVWVIYLKSAQNFRVQHFDACRDFGLTITGFGTDLDRLDELMIGLGAKTCELTREAIRL